MGQAPGQGTQEIAVFREAQHLKAGDAAQGEPLAVVTECAGLSGFGHGGLLAASYIQKYIWI